MAALLTSSICLISVSVALSEIFPTNTVVATLISDADMLFCGHKKQKQLLTNCDIVSTTMLYRNTVQ